MERVGALRPAPACGLPGGTTCRRSGPARRPGRGQVPSPTCPGEGQIPAVSVPNPYQACHGTAAMVVPSGSGTGVCLCLVYTSSFASFDRVGFWFPRGFPSGLTGFRPRPCRTTADGSVFWLVDQCGWSGFLIWVPYLGSFLVFLLGFLCRCSLN